MSEGRDEMNTEGREGNAAQPLNAAEDNAGAERYPSVRQDDSVERTGRTEQVTGESGEPRSFDPAADAPTRQGAGDTTAPTSANEGRLGPGADPVEGKR
ncbi:hypothetical protein [Phenylobacterium sp.]|uniref:hypothetical protein n=1 Tax=Phenylobacterium sp. TaxID=1871053 RepID=UPI0035B23EEC